MRAAEGKAGTSEGGGVGEWESRGVRSVRSVRPRPHAPTRLALCALLLALYPGARPCWRPAAGWRRPPSVLGAALPRAAGRRRPDGDPLAAGPA